MILDASHGPLKIRDEYNCTRLAPASIFASAVSGLSTPPAPIKGNWLSTRRWACASILVDGKKSGRPDKPPCSAAAGSFSDAGRAMVVFETISPSICLERAHLTISSSSASVRSGAIFKSTGLRANTSDALSRAARTRARRSSRAPARCKSRKPGVLGDEILIVK